MTDAADPDSPDARLAGFIDEYAPAIAGLAREVLAAMQARLPGAVRLVYNNYNALVIGFGPSERASEAVFSVALYPRWVNLFFLQGASLEDPDGLLRGEGKQVRSVRLGSVSELEEPGLKALMAAALAQAAVGLDRPREGARLVIQPVADERRARRPR